jgi:uncharacterized membrane protein
MSRNTTVVLAVLALVVVVVTVFAAVTYPRTLVSSPVSFTVGVQSETVTFDQPTLNNKVQVQVSVENGVALWNAKLLNGEAVIWEHSKGQGEQTTYTSEWMELTSGTYNFTFGTIGAGSLQATVTVSSKGGFW